MQLSRVALMALLFLAACSKSKDDKGKDEPDPPPGGNNDPVTITSTSPEFVFWGEELTINGTGFSTNKADNFVWFYGDNNCGTDYRDSTDWKKAEIVSATATKLVVKVPYAMKDERPCGNDFAGMHLTVKGKPTVSPTEVIKMMGVPIPQAFCDNYGGGYYASSGIHPGDSVYLEFGGYGLLNLRYTGNEDKIHLKVGTLNIPMKKWKGPSGCGSYGGSFILDRQTFAKAKCDPLDPAWGVAGELKKFELYIDGIALPGASKEFFVLNLPKSTVTEVSGPAEVSKSGGGNPFWKVKGKNMHYSMVKFIALSPCSGSVETATSVCNSFCDEFHIYIPLSLLNSECSYSMFLIDACGKTKHIGGIKITP